MLQHGDDFPDVELFGSREKLILEMLKQDALVEIDALLAEHVESRGVFSLGSLLEKFSGDLVVLVDLETVPVHVAQVDQSVTVVVVVSSQEVLVGFVVVFVDDSGDPVKVDSAQVDHGVGVAVIRCFHVLSYSQLSVLLHSIAAEVAVSKFVLGSWIVESRSLNEEVYGLPGAFLHSEAMLVEESEIEEGFGTFLFVNF
jgi:hypothetical protein